jgi:hypothetical protein
MVVGTTTGGPVPNLGQEKEAASAVFSK